MPVPNLDAMTTENLIAFSERHQYGREYKRLFDRVSRFVVPDTSLLASYAHCKACERLCAAREDMPQSVVYQRMAAEFYKKLSPDAKWRKI